MHRKAQNNLSNALPGSAKVKQCKTIISNMIIITSNMIEMRDHFESF